LQDPPLCVFGAGHCTIFSIFLTIVPPWKSVKKYCQYFIDFFNERVAIDICETDPGSSIEAGGLFSNMAALSLHGRRHLEFSIQLLIG